MRRVEGWTLGSRRRFTLVDVEGGGGGGGIGNELKDAVSNQQLSSEAPYNAHSVAVMSLLKSII